MVRLETQTWLSKKVLLRLQFNVDRKRKVMNFATQNATGFRNFKQNACGLKKWDAIHSVWLALFARCCEQGFLLILNLNKSCH